MNRLFKLLIIAVTLGAIISLGTYFYKREGSYSGICVVGVVSPCNGDILYDRGYPARYIDPDDKVDLKTFTSNVFFWSILSFVALQTIDIIKNRNKTA